MVTDDSDKPYGNSELPSTISSNLLLGVRQGDNESWIRLVDLYYSMLYGWCRRAGLKPDNAADVCQEVLKSVATSLHTFQRDSEGHTFRGWLRRITQRRIIDFRKKHNEQPNAIGGSEIQGLLANVTDTGSGSMSPNNNAGILQALTDHICCEFETSTWQAFWKTMIDGEATDDVARDLGISRNAVYLARSRVLRRLREAFREFDPSLDDGSQE